MAKQSEQVQEIPISELFPFKDHPFRVLDDEAMQRTVESISQFGVLAPAIARPRPEGGYEIIAGHASEIDVRLGATWIDKKYIQAFMEDLLQPPFYLRRSIVVNYSPYTAEWSITGKKNVSYRDVNAYTTYGTSRINAYQILQDSLNLRDSRVYDTVEDPDGKERRVLNQKETTLAQQKQQAIKDAFRDWIWKDPERRQTLVELYNEKFNSTRPREYDGTHISLEELLSSTKKDDVVTFEQLGVDRLFVDEAHGYKNLFLYTKMQNVAGISTTDAQKSSDMYMKCQ